MPCLLRFNSLLLAGLVVLAALPAFSETTEGLIARALVPGAWFAQAEISLQQAGSETVVRSIFHTRFVGRVRDDILATERKNWGEDPDAGAYGRVLRDAFTRYADLREQRPESVLVVDFITAPSTARVALAFARVDRAGKAWDIQDRAIWTNLPLSRRYIIGNQRFILQEAFGKDSAPAVREWARLNHEAAVEAKR